MPFHVVNFEQKLAEMKRKSPEFAAAWDRSRTEYKILGELVSIRKQKGISQAELAERAGFKQQTISRIEKRESSPTLKTLCGLLYALDLDIQFVPRGS
ncbi:MAG: helix-turn-helix domain-containing protein [Oscillospiraceae bacterium]|jgi:DNA-binding XRE family transcriptional regulator|nr:helix-turn-helix domain-containing protein [Oscillospiraceae bacterium]